MEIDLVVLELIKSLDLFGSVASIFSIAVYFLPYLLSLFLRQHHSAYIFWTNLIFGWTGVGWFGVLIWVLMSGAGAAK